VLKTAIRECSWEPQDEILKLNRERQNIMAGGVDIPSQLIELGLVDEYRVVVQPIVAAQEDACGMSTCRESLHLNIVSQGSQSGCVALRYLKHERKLATGAAGSIQKEKNNKIHLPGISARKIRGMSRVTQRSTKCLSTTTICVPLVAEYLFSDGTGVDPVLEKAKSDDRRPLCGNQGTAPAGYSDP